MSRSQKNIRNFSIVAHIDHGKSTLADRLIEATQTLTEREMNEQILDNMDLERERGITIKAQAVRLIYRRADGEEYYLNMIDTPGHVDFNYEVSRSLQACEGAILVVDATQGIQAQTLANTYLAMENNLEIVPVINKMDLASARPEEAIAEIEDIIGISAHDAPQISAKTGLNIESVLEAIVKKIPAPVGKETDPLRALIFDSYYDPYRGVVAHVRVKDGVVKKGDRIRFMNSKSEYEVTELGVFIPPTCPRTICAPAMSATSPLRSKMSGMPAWVTPSRWPPIRLKNPCRGIKKLSPWSFPGSIPSMVPVMMNCAKRWKNCR